MPRLLLPRDICHKCICPVQDGEEFERFEGGKAHVVCPPTPKMPLIDDDGIPAMKPKK